VTVESVTSSVEIGGLLFAYDQRVLEPRPWTRAQSEWARDLLDEVPDGPVLELCSGAGHIGLLALLGNQRPLVMVDADEVACRFARMNAIAAGLVDRVEIRHGQLEEQVRPSEVGRFPQDPVLAIDGGVDGLGPTRGCLHVIDQHLDRAGCAVLQVGGPAHVTGIGEWLDSRPSVRLRVSETRAFGDRGVLVLLRRPSGDEPC
jgi:ribosomal protein L3 glutamine methyltransferase